MYLQPPGDIGRRLLPTLIDKIAATDPGRITHSFMRTKDPLDGFHDVSAKAFSQAVDRCAWHIEKSLGRGSNFPTLLYMGPQDLVSPRNTLEAHLSLLEKTSCNTFLMPPIFPLPIVKEIQSAWEMRVLEIPGPLHWLNEDDPSKPYPFTKTWAEAALEPFVVLHTSGSTGIPKPIVLSHKTMSSMDAFNAAPLLGYPDVYPNLCKGSRLYFGMPYFHLAGMLLSLHAPWCSEFTSVTGPFPPSVELVNSVHIHGNVQHSIQAAMIWAGIVETPEYLENLRQLDGVGFGGGPCPEAVGDAITERVRLWNCIGATETGLLPIQPLDREDWKYLSPSPLMKHEFRLVADDLYELYIIRDPELDMYQGIFGTFLDLKEYSMKDLYSRHPTKANTWLYKGRVDDIVVFSSGEKLNPLDMEGMLLAHPAVNGAVVAGQGCNQSSLLIEPKEPATTTEERKTLLIDIWPTIESANKISPSHGRVHRDMAIITSPDKPMPRAGKGTVQRKPTLNLYADEIKELYSQVESRAKVASNKATNDYHNTGDTLALARQIVAESASINADDLGVNDDLFYRGLDSLQVTAIVKSLNESLSNSQSSRSTEAKDIYAKPTLSGLVVCIEGSADTTALSGEETMRTSYDDYTSKLPVTGRQPLPKSDGSHVVLLTGSTGSLGSYILESLLNNPKITRIFCLNRVKGQEDHARHKGHLVERGLSPTHKKIVHLNAEIWKPRLGLEKPDYQRLVSEVTLVIHNAWKVDFNQSFDSFAGNISSVQNLIDFSAVSTFGAEIFFISSISTVASKVGKVAEEIVDDWDAPELMGYAQSKFVSEKILNQAAKEGSVPASIFRVGQIAGPTTNKGHWPKQEWLPSLIQSSKYLGKLPESLGPMNAVDWIPVDVLGQIVVELATSPSLDADARRVKVYHGVNPRAAVWQSLIPTIKRSLGLEVQAVPLEEWVEALIQSASKTEDLEVNPALKIRAFFEGLKDKSSEGVTLPTSEAVKASKTLASLEPVREEWMANWLRQWGYQAWEGQ